MAEEDIYQNKRKYERFMKQLEQYLEPPEPSTGLGKRKRYCRNPANLKYFEMLDRHFAARDISYIRRNKICYFLLFITSLTGKDLARPGTSVIPPGVS